MIFKNLEEECRYYQGLTNYHLMPNSFVICHLDGRSFSKLIKNRFKLPFDHDFIDMMNETAIYLCENVQGCCCAYVQSDEISLVLSDVAYRKDGKRGTMFFEGRLCKMQSIMASLATGKFNQMLTLYDLKMNEYESVPNKKSARAVILDMHLAQFDCKCWNVPDLDSVYGWLAYRNRDCVRNSKQQAAQTYCSHKALLGKNTDEQIELMKLTAGIDWNNYTDGEKYGRVIIRVPTEMETTIEKTGETIKFIRNKWMVSGMVIGQSFSQYDLESIVYK